MKIPSIPEKLWAKSARNGQEQLRLEKHLLDAEEAASLLFHPERRWGRNWVRFFNLASTQQHKFLLNLRVAGLFHDIGKANEGFYRAVTSHQFQKQPVRHEHFSALLLHLPEVRQWLSANPELDVEVITASVLSHHLKASKSGDFKWCAREGLDPEVFLFLGHEEVGAILRRIADIATLASPPILNNTFWNANSADWKKVLKDGEDTACEFARKLRRGCDPERRNLLLAVKSGLIVADSVASGLVREGKHISQWIEEVAHGPAIRGDIVDRDILQPRIDRINERFQALRGPFEYHKFQDLASQQPRRALLLAACGAGKSMAAWRWAQSQLDQQELGRVIFLYPTRGTATEGFRDYVGPAPESALLHGTAAYELEAIQSNPEDERNAHLNNKKLGLSEEEERLYALGYWSKRFFSATIDQFLSFMTHSYMSLCLLPVLADSALIIDEVHSFDSKMFEALEHFLKTFDLPVLAMTATLSPDRRKRLVELGLKVFPDEGERELLEDLSAKEKHPRYRIQIDENYDSGRSKALSMAIHGYKNRQRVLWVVNRVDECQKIVQSLRDEHGIHAICYHSRFRLKDRQQAHQNTIEAFQQRETPVIAVTTQVCEMSLDLDTDVLLTELAPPSSLVQRMGRANRHLAHGHSFLADILVYEPAKTAPYEKKDLDKKFINSLLGHPISQSELANALEVWSPGERMRDEDGPFFLNSGYFAVAGKFRDTDDFSQSCLLDSDVETVLQRIKNRENYDEFIVPIPRSNALRKPPSKIPRHLFIAPSAQYDKTLGYQKESKGSP